jgi:hypothetical protein
MQPLAILSALHHGSGAMSLELVQQSADELSLARRPYAEIRIHPEITDAFTSRIRQLVEGKVAPPAEPPAAGILRTDPLTASGRGLFNEVLPERHQEIRSIRDALGDLKKDLLIATNVPEIPWELLHNGTDFLGLLYDIGRSLRARGAEWRPTPKKGNWQCLILANPTGDLPSAAAEAVAVKESLESKGIACDYLFEKTATFENVLHYLNSVQYDIIHYSGHIARDEESGEYGFRLRDGRSFTAESIRTHVRTPAIAFLNGCNSGEVVQGLTEAFLSSGAQMVIGSLYDTPNRGAAAFAKKFYAEFMRGRTAGEAMRQARLHVRGMEDCGLAWACFVMYGDPRFSLDLKSDDLDSWLAKAGFERAHFDAAATKVLQRAVAYGLITKGVSTAIFFAALVEGEDPFLRKRLEMCGVLDLLEGAFKAALKSGTAESSPAEKASEGETEASRNVIDVLRLAQSICAEKGMEKITELCLASAFSRQTAGGAWAILKKLDVKPADLDPWRSGGTAHAIGRIGNLDPEICSPLAWQILLRAAHIGMRAEPPGITASYLFQAMAGAPDSMLESALRRIGLEVSSSFASFPSHGDPPAFDPSGERLLCSRNVADILKKALALAGARSTKVEEQDLLAALAENGGGRIGATLLEHGVPVRMLTSRLFLDGGVIDTGRFDENGQSVMDEAFAAARLRGSAIIGRAHLLYALLTRSKLLAEEIGRQGMDTGMLAEMLFMSLPEHPGTLPEVPRWSTFSTGLLKILCDAEAIAARAGAQGVDDEQLLRAWCADQGGASREFLVRNGVRVTKLLRLWSAVGSGEWPTTGAPP